MNGTTIIAQIFMSLKAVFQSIALIWSTTTTARGRNVLTFITREMLASNCFSGKESVNLHQKE